MTAERQQAGSVAWRDQDLSPAGALVRRHDPDRFLICLFVPPPTRDAAFTLIAFNHELARAVEVVGRRATGANGAAGATGATETTDASRMTAAIRLQWWREVVEGGWRRHEVADPLGRLLETGVIERASLLALIEAREAELDGPASSVEAWWSRLEQGPGRLARAVGALTGLEGAMLDWCGTAGAAYGAGAGLRHRARLAALGRHPVPADEAGTDVAGLAGVAIDRLRLLPTFRAARSQRAAALHAVLAARDLRRVRDGNDAAPSRRPVSDTAAVAFSWWSGRIG